MTAPKVSTPLKGLFFNPKATLSIAFGILTAIHQPAISRADEKVTGRANLFVVEEKPSSGGDTSLSAVTFSDEAVPAPGKSLKLFCDASMPVVVLVAAFEAESGAVLKEFLPVCLSREEGYAEFNFPDGDVRIPFEKPASLEFFVVYFSAKDSQLPKIRTLIDAMTVSANEGKEELFLQQSGFLRNAISNWIRDMNRTELTFRNPEPAIAGLRRGSQISWQEHAHAFDIDLSRPTVRIFQVGK